MLMLNLHHFLARSTVNGPGTRAVIWVQGCARRCAGCFNPATHDLGVRTLVSVATLAEQILALPDLEGLTFSGGEPFLQAAALAELGRRVQRAGLGIVVFTGFRDEELTRSSNAAWAALLAVTDLLIAGPFCQEQACPGGLRGSRNQRLVFLSDRYQSCQATLEQPSADVEILIAPSGEVTLTGFPGESFALR